MRYLYREFTVFEPVMTLKGIGIGTVSRHS